MTLLENFGPACA